MTEMTDKRNAEADPARKVPDLNRYSRHYYDVHQIWTDAEHGINTASMADLAEASRRHKELMFRAPDHRYDRAVPGSYRLVQGCSWLTVLALSKDDATETWETRPIKNRALDPCGERPIGLGRPRGRQAARQGGHGYGC